MKRMWFLSIVVIISTIAEILTVVALVLLLPPPADMLVIATSLLVLTAFLTLVTNFQLGDQVVRLGRTMIQPYLYVRVSYKEEREKATAERQLDPTHIEQRGIWLQNIGLGDAINGTIYLVTESEEIPIVEPGDKYSFNRIPSRWIYMYPSRRCPTLAEHLNKPESYIRNPATNERTQRILLKVVYYDIQHTKYELSKEQQEIDLCRAPDAINTVSPLDEMKQKLFEAIKDSLPEAARKLVAVLSDLEPESVEKLIRKISEC